MNFIKGQLYQIRKDIECNSEDWLKHKFKYTGIPNKYEVIYDMYIKNVGSYPKGDIITLPNIDMELAKEPKSHLPIWW